MLISIIIHEGRCNIPAELREHSVQSLQPAGRSLRDSCMLADLCADGTAASEGDVSLYSGTAADARVRVRW
eukprot:2534386-Pleurochrysis_carterae.AAC.3